MQSFDFSDTGGTRKTRRGRHRRDHALKFAFGEYGVTPRVRTQNFFPAVKNVAGRSVLFAMRLSVVYVAPRRKK